MSVQPGSSADRIIIIDDDPSVHDAFRKAMRRDKKGESPLTQALTARPDQNDTGKATLPERELEIDSAYSGQDGLKRVTEAARAKRPFAMAFVDMRMPPGWDGVKTIQELWKACPDLQICICSAFSDYSWESIIEKLGYTDKLLILRKPFEREEVLQLAHMLTRKWHRERQERELTNPEPPAPPFHLLLLEDEVLTSTFLQKKLKEAFPEVTLLSATTVAEAQALLETQVIDFFLLDIFVPDGSGIDFLFQVMAAQPNARAVVMTGQALGEYRAVAEQLGVLDFVEKPVSMPELSARIRSQIEAKAAAAHGTSCFAATLTQLTTIDIIQLKCLAKATVTLDFIRRDGVRGRVWFDRGEIVHAEAPGRDGEAAFAEIVGWRNGRAQEAPGVKPAQQTIATQWQNLLLNTAQMLDERTAA